MGAFNSAVITAKGQALLAKAVLNTVDLEFTRIAVSENKLTGDLVSKTGIGTVKQEAKVASVKRTNNSSVKVSASIANNNLTSGYYVRNIGLYAKDPDEGEILYSISVADESTATADWMPPYNGVGVSSFMVDLITVVGNSDNVKVEVDPTAFATVAQIIEVNEHLTALDNTITTTTEKTLRGSVAGGLKLNKISGMTRKCTNLFDKSKVDTKYVTEIETGFSFTNNNESLSPTSVGTLKDLAPTLRVGDSITFYADCVNAHHSAGFIYLTGSNLDWYSGTFHTITQSDLDNLVLAYGLLNKVCEYKNFRLVKIENAPYEPYFEGLRSAAVTAMESVGVNLTTAKAVYTGANRYLETVVDDRNCIRFTSGSDLIRTPVTFKPNTQYTVSFYAKGEDYDGASTSNTGFSFVYEDNTHSSIYIQKNDPWALRTLTSAPGKTVVAVGVKSSEYRAYVYIDIDTFVLNEGNTALPYTPYVHSKITLTQPIVVDGIPVSSGGNYTDENGQQWLCNEYDFVNGKYIQRVGEVDLGTLNWEYDAGYGRFRTINVPNAKRSARKTPCISDRYISYTKGEPLNSVRDKSIYFAGDVTADLYIHDSDYITPTELKDAVSGALFYYALAEPVKIPLSDKLPIADQILLCTLSSHDDVTHILTDSKENPHIEVEYGTNKTGAHTLSGLLTAQRNELKLAELTSAVLALNQE